MLALCVGGALAGLTVDDQAQTVVQGATGSCTRYYGADGYVGCGTTKQDGVAAEIFGITTAAHLDAFVAGTGQPGQRVLVMSLGLLNKVTMTKLLATKRVAGILLLQEEKAPEAWSPGGNANGFNPSGFDFLGEKFDFPMSLVDQTQSAAMLRYAQGNRDAAASSTLLPVYKVKLDFFMGPSASNAKVCLQWRTLTGAFDPKCVPVGGESVWSMHVPPGAEPLMVRDVVMATAQMDARSAFYGLAPGADTAVSGAVALLAAARALQGKVTADMNAIAFALFQGESWNAMGSTTFVDDILNFACEVPARDRNGNELCLKPAMGSLAFKKLNTTLRSVVAVDQVGKKGAKLFVHAAQPSDDFKTVANTEKSTKFGTAADAPTGTASAFKAMAGVHRFVLSGYDTDFNANKNSYFSGHLDQVATVDTDQITVAATALAKTLWTMAGGAEEDGPAADAQIVKELFECVTQNWDCALWKTPVSALNKAVNKESGLTYPLPPVPSIDGKDRKPAATSLDLYTSTVWGQRPFGAQYAITTRLPYVLQPNIKERCPERNSSEACEQGGTNGCYWTAGACADTGGILNYLDSNATWDSSKDAILVWPNRYELSAFAFLANASNAALNVTQDGAYYHTAVSRALKLPQYASAGSAQGGAQYDVLDNASATTRALLFAEPYWSSVSAVAYADAGDAVAYGALATGLGVAAVGIVCAKQTSQFLTKQKLL